ncbi:hypothetical protein HX004_07655 [Myroides sp. 1354]|uniref:hypothetical protein n=1 Tax=unclassified Myroides TaxID=2642485 RepID=UPI00257565E8|nr:MULTISPECIES: hypothetical protein [unclassified Myroides]MDM1044936.1 hypothetical protein [Myroides sp. R163-1]MDM1055649.1 hypothetical protein [Myroides sp. 1354]MDM1068946.1 hypothetical protein [Myroides sp. 1372]
MKNIYTHIFLLFFLLFVGATKVLGTPVNVENISLKAVNKAIVFQVNEFEQLKYSETKIYNPVNAFSTIEADNGDFNFQDQQDQLVLGLPLVKVFFYAISLHFIFFAIKRRRTSYQALIQLFDHKYIVYRILRI